MDWLVHRRVFGNSGYPWSSPQYSGDPQATFECPNANAVMEVCFLMPFHENWGEPEIRDAIQIFHKVDEVFAL
jgi:hypothetical protein